MSIFNPKVEVRRPSPLPRLSVLSADRNSALLLPLIFFAPAYAKAPSDNGKPHF